MAAAWRKNRKSGEMYSCRYWKTFFIKKAIFAERINFFAYTILRPSLCEKERERFKEY